MSSRKRWLSILAVAALVAVGGGAAIGATGANPASDFLGDVAKRLGISKQKLQDAITEATIARIDAAVARGDLTKEEGDRLKERVRSGDTAGILPRLDGFGRGPWFFGPGLFGHGPLGGRTDLLGTAADYLGLTRAELREATAGGKSLAQVAKDKGKSVDGLKKALRDAVGKNLDQAVKNGDLTKEQAARLKEAWSSQIDRFVDGTGLGRGFGFQFRFGDRGFEFRFDHGGRRSSFSLSGSAPAAAPAAPI